MIVTLPDGITGHRHDHGVFSTFFLSAGTGPNVLLIHGSGPGVSGLANWRGTMASPLSRSHHFIALDVVGFGQTTTLTDLAIDHDVRVRHVIGFIESLGTGAVNIIGNSLGGAIALAIAHRRPELVGRMVLMGTVGIDFSISPGLEQVWGYTPSLENMRELISLFAYDQTLVDDDDLVRIRHEASITPTTHERYAATFGAPRQRHVDAAALTDDELRAVAVPTLLIHGANDRVIPLRDTSERLVNLLPNADLVVFGRCGHWTQIERATDFQKQVSLFFSS